MKSKKLILGLLCGAFLLSSAFGVQEIVGKADEVEEENGITSEISVDQDFDGVSNTDYMQEKRNNSCVCRRDFRK